ncbi:MAG: RNA methyltransferase [Candidatus Moranbacteria bacterium]|nr:RNA methyltransferase [Candidatus Moranbacteria bacterium]OIQ03083.1 MAG: hypothetical protein AUK58_02130 [Candidatus Moranbacteria bacterium CG2_30_41_165]PIP25694.1 MAG: RNA methyltransferase [Candidatus Moranbacteria bacterium CG23_combo_of_CG06-09_8_20_14_all_41_28]PIW94038.1 MAG: RNA methyltransferase [Candidatus Moranbacteria bacterium CG_4_8_14_3_um_filter_41_13]PIX91445.1 MAG: RNA methyltransferase [Candidatus Moranbacteria bacterium CG_4_10_14_3_um_filter_41_65]PJC00507.1 MAG: RNA
MSREQRTKRLILIIHNVRSAHNVGALFRTADGAGVERIFLSGYTPAPAIQGTSYLTKAEKALIKTALGAEQTIAWERVKSFSSVAERLHKEAFDIVALEQTENSIYYEEYSTKKNSALVVGNEVKGIDKSILKQCDAIIELPMYGKKNSLNVSVAGGIALYFLSRIM